MTTKVIVIESENSKTHEKAVNDAIANLESEGNHIVSVDISTVNNKIPPGYGNLKDVICTSLIVYEPIDSFGL